MDINLFRKCIEFYNPWWKQNNSLLGIPVYRRSSYDDIFNSVLSIDQIISVTGPRRVGKTTILKQVVSDLVTIENINPFDIMYISMDDPFIYSIRHSPGIFDDIISNFIDYTKDFGSEGKKYIFIDEIQRFDGWELFLKKYYDSKMNFKFIISGSYSSFINIKSKESLAGRIKNFKLFPFSFEEYLTFTLLSDDLADIRMKESILKSISDLHTIIAPSIFGDFKFEASLTDILSTVNKLAMFEDELFKYFNKYLLYGGFIEGWMMPNEKLQYEYLYQTQIEKILLEDIYLIEDIKNTDVLSSLFFYLAINFTDEFSILSLAEKLKVHRETIEKYLKILEESNLILRLEKYQSNINKASNVKIFLIDHGVRNSILKVREEDILSSPELFNKYIMNLLYVFIQQKGNIVDCKYYRNRDKEMDFIFRSSSGVSVCIDIKGRKFFQDLSGKLKIENKILITRDFNISYDNGLLKIPYIIFLLS